MRKITIVALLLVFGKLYAQDAIDYKIPPAAINDLVSAKPTPGVLFDDKGQWAVIMERSSMPGVEELAQPELRIAGLRINPNNYGPSRSTYTTNLVLKNIRTGAELPITGLPKPLKAGSVSWNPDDSKISFTQTNNATIDLYVIDVATRKASKINRSALNLIGGSYSWFDNNSILYSAALKPAGAAPARLLAPKGPVIQENLGKVAGSPTFQDLIKSPYDEALFEFYATSQLIKNTNGIETKIGSPAINLNYDPSPDKKYLLVNRIDKPYSYLVPATGFNSTIYVADMNGKMIRQIVKKPSSELTPRGNDNVLNAPRGHQWLDNSPATLMWIEPLDSGLIKSKVEFHDQAYTLSAPFTGSPKPLVKTTMRLSSISAVSDNFYMVSEISRGQRKSRISRLDPATGKLEVLIDRSIDDGYNDPGTPVRAKNKYGRNAIRLVDGNKLLMRSVGSTPTGDMPFLAKFNIDDKKSEILWRSADPDYETVTDVIDFENLVVITSKQSQTEQPNYYIRNLKAGTVSKVTNFPDQQPGLRGVTKQKINYKRKDGVDLTADLYLPSGYDKAKDGPLPVLMWAYPREFKSAADAAQVRGSNNTFTRIGYGSPVFWVKQGYAVMDNTEFPIVGEGDKQPNDNFIDQLTWNAEAAINKITELGYGDPKRVAVGGHSYGAFMTANLLAHTKLFKAGIARSGAYNRTLTPFGFQNEERTYWQAPEVYNRMSPFGYADKIKTPILLIHGEADNNSGTFPIQSERLFNAIKGHGGTVRFVQLPFESHGYAAKENILHMLWEMDQWLERYVKNAK